MAFIYFFKVKLANWSSVFFIFPQSYFSLACAIRPTSAITWVYVALLGLFVTRDRLKFIFLEASPIGALVLGLTCLLDHLMYGSWVFVPLNFLKFSFLSSGGDYYGTHKWHWYFTGGFSVTLFTFLPFSISGIIFSKQRKLLGLIAWVLGLYSVLGHKEFRFVLPVLPVALMFSGYSLYIISRRDFSKRKRKRYPRNCVKCLSKSQRGAEGVMNYISREAISEQVKNVIFLTPCHATPYYSTLHQNLPMRFLDCSPRHESWSV